MVWDNWMCTLKVQEDQPNQYSSVHTHINMKYFFSSNKSTYPAWQTIIQEKTLKKTIPEVW